MDRLGVAGEGGMMGIKWALRKWNISFWAGFIWLRMETCGELL
jgi:hypothetical protein